MRKFSTFTAAALATATALSLSVAPAQAEEKEAPSFTASTLIYDKVKSDLEEKKAGTDAAERDKAEKSSRALAPLVELDKKAKVKEGFFFEFLVGTGIAIAVTSIIGFLRYQGILPF